MAKMSNPRGYEIRAEADGGVVITIYDVIGKTWDGEGITAKAVADALKKAKKTAPVTVNINSPGGLVFEAAAIHNALTRHKGRVVVNIDGAALSAASVVAMAGDAIYMAENALMMIHDPWNIAGGTAADFRDVADAMDKVKDTIARTYAARGDLDVAKAGELMSAETWLSAEEALELGLIDEITEAKRVAASCDAATLERAPEWARERFDAVNQATAVAENSKQEQDMAENKDQPAVEQPKVATVAELKNAFPESDAEFREGCTENNCTLAQALERWTKQVEATNQTLNAKNAELSASAEESAEKIAALEAELAEAKAAAAKPADDQRDLALQHGADAAGGDPADDEAGWKAEYARDAKLRNEFGEEGAYLAFKRIEARGGVRIKGA